MKISAIITLLIINSCTQFVQTTDEEYYAELSGSGHHQLNILFSHNINGETHPCGCRNFPLGGIPTVHAVIKSLQGKEYTLYVDSGDTFFPLPIVPGPIRTSSEFSAKKIAESLDLAGLKYFTPGDQDFALGENFLIDISKKHKFKFLISNASKEMKIKHKKLGIIKVNKITFFFIGIIEPSIVAREYRNLLLDPKKIIAEQLAKIENKYKEVKNKKIILLSHAGINFDKEIAKEFQKIDWIIGAHSQAYLYQTVDIGHTKLVQVLSRNHFLGHITIPFQQSGKSAYKIIEMREEKKDLIPNNPMVGWLQSYKTKLDAIQRKEQEKLEVTAEHSKLPSFISCSECHTKQTEFWQATSHSLAWQTLIKEKATHNQACIGCHSVGFKAPKGFITHKGIVLSDNKDFDSKQYWKDFRKEIVKKNSSIRKMTKQQRFKISKRALAFDQKRGVAHNFSNVQCLNCHGQTAEHPFDVELEKTKPNYQKNCLNCHTKDQSPEWYQKDSKELATSLNKKYFEQKLKQMSCPKIERN